MKVLVDGVFFQLARSGIARIWATILPKLAQTSGIEILMLDRGGAPQLPGITKLDFPSYRGSNSAADSFLIEKVGRHFEADVFVSTYYTSPISIPSVLMVYDMIPEVLGFNLAERMWQEKETAICFARRLACISHNTRSDLLTYYPEISPALTSVTYCGVDRAVFSPRSTEETQSFLVGQAITRPYYVLVGARQQTQGYKNCSLFFNAIKAMAESSFDILCVGGEPEISPEHLDGLPAGVGVKRLELSDDELAKVYTGAEALIFPSLYEGFGLPLVEAMACGCPIITTRNGSLGEVAADAAELISGYDVDEMIAALKSLRNPMRRLRLIKRGRGRASTFSWDVMATDFGGLLGVAALERYDNDAQQFFDDWRRLRRIQAAVDTSD
jgi:glycosyltransferase involved in cell wall biosynthesis